MRQINRVRAVALAAVCACTGSPLSSGNTVLSGEWGGLHAALTLTAQGGTIAYDCAHGGLSAPVIPDRAGHFEVPGVHVPEHGGPVRIGEVPDSIPARYFGEVSGDRMSLRVLVGADTLGPYSLQRDGVPQLFRCL